MASNSSGDLGSSVKTESERIDNVSRQNQDADRGREHTGPLSDDERLRMLGYDAVLGRPFGFWSSAAMNVCHNSFIFEFIAYTSLYAWNGPLLFVIGYPFLALFHFLLLAPFSELVSTFPVAGGMATWAWQCARHGIRGERQWGWIVSGMTLAMHLGKTIAYLYLVSTSLVQVYIITSGEKFNIMTQQALEPKQWWHPVFYLVLVTIVTVLTMSRISRNSTFWTIAGAYNLCVALLTFLMLVVCAVKLHTGKLAAVKFPPVNWGFPKRSQWIYGFSRMIFMGLPLRVTAIDCPIHMAEETSNPSWTVPRVMWATTILHFTMVYITVIMFIVIVVPSTMGFASITPVLPMGTIMGISIKAMVALTCLGTVCTITQVLASTVITSRFIFALARDKGIPFSKWLVVTSKDKEPWVAMATLLASLYLSTLGWFTDLSQNTSHYYRILQVFSFYFITIPYLLPLFLYVTSKIDLRHAGRSEFSLRGWSRPLAWVALGWLLLCLVQGSMPLTVFNGAPIDPTDPASVKKERISYLPIVIGVMLVILFASWWLYGRRNYVGPIRALTKWSAGVEIDSSNSSGPNRDNVVKKYIQQQNGRPPTASAPAAAAAAAAAEPITPVRPTFTGSNGSKGSGSPGNVGSPSRGASTLQRLLGVRSSTSKSNRPSSSELGNSTHLQHAPMGVSVLPESGILPETQTQIGAASVLPESGIFPNGETDSRDGTFSHAQIESQLLPEEPRANFAPRASRRMTFRPSVLTVGEQSYPLAELTPPPRSPPTPLSPPPRGKKGSQGYMSGRPYESQFESTQSFGELIALPDRSLIAPDQSFPESVAMQESQLYPSTQVESFTEPAALQESQLEPSRW